MNRFGRKMRIPALGINTMQTILMIGCGTIGGAVVRYLAPNETIRIGAAIIEPGAEQQAREVFGADVELSLIHI